MLCVRDILLQNSRRDNLMIWDSVTLNFYLLSQGSVLLHHTLFVESTVVTHVGRVVRNFSSLCVDETRKSISL